MLLNQQNLETVFNPILLHPAWQVKLGFGSFLTFEFGSPHLEIREPMDPPVSSPSLNKRKIIIKGDWHFWVYCCNWEIYNSSILLAHNESDRIKMSEAASCLDGQILSKVKLNLASMRCELLFDSGGSLQMWKNENIDEDQWMLFHNKNTIFTLNSKNEIESQ